MGRTWLAPVPLNVSTDGVLHPGAIWRWDQEELSSRRSDKEEGLCLGSTTAFGKGKKLMVLSAWR
jgi:hypothetical protein